ncbi:MAG: hypothetical protein ACRD0B_07685, partial [Acidimicrobiales bacterium]
MTTDVIAMALGARLGSPATMEDLGAARRAPAWVRPALIRPAGGAALGAVLGSVPAAGLGAVLGSVPAAGLGPATGALLGSAFGAAIGAAFGAAFGAAGAVTEQDREPSPPAVGPPMRSVSVSNANRYGRRAALAWWGQDYPGLRPEAEPLHGPAARRAARRAR